MVNISFNVTSGLFNSSNSLVPVVKYSPAAVTFALTCAILCTVSGIFGNGATIAALMLNKKLRSAATTIFVVSLSVTDLIFCGFNLPITAVRYSYQSWVLGDTLCQLFPFFFYLNVAASLFNIMAITINRFILIGFNRRYDQIYTKKKIGLMIAICWAIPLCILLPTLFQKWGRFGLREETFSCTILRYKGASPKKAFFLIGFLLPCVVIIACYSGIFWIVCQSRKKLTRHQGAKNRRSEDDMCLTRMIAAIFSTFLLCYLPLMLANVGDSDETIPWIHIIASCLAWSASVWNPVVYALMNKRYRQAYGRLIRCGDRGGWLKKYTSEHTNSSKPSVLTTSFQSLDHVSVNSTNQKSTKV